MSQYFKHRSETVETCWWPVQNHGSQSCSHSSVLLSGEPVLQALGQDCGDPAWDQLTTQVILSPLRIQACSHMCSSNSKKPFKLRSFHSFIAFCLVVSNRREIRRGAGWRLGLQAAAGLLFSTFILATFYRSASLYHPQVGAARYWTLF